MVQALSTQVNANPMGSVLSMQLLEQRFVPHMLFNMEMDNLKASVASLQ
jgi:hypothetical protein